jgi:hypothetical protein
MVAVNWSNMTSLSQLPAAANTATGDVFWVGILYMIWLILLLILISFSLEVAILTSSFLALIIGLLLVYGNLVAWQWILPFVGIMLFMFLYITWTNQPNR